MSRPGDRLRALASRVFDAETMERLIDPVVADLQMEYDVALRAGRIWPRLWVRAIGYGALFYVVVGKLRVFLALLVAFTVLFDLPALLRSGFTMTRAVYLVPQALVVAVPMALTLTIASAHRSPNRARQTMIATIVSGAICSTLVFVIFAWLVPSANQAFRVSWARETGMTYRPPPGPPEMTIGELRQLMKWATTGHVNWVHVDRRELEFTYYFRWAFGFASLSLAVFALSLRRLGFGRRFMSIAGIPTIFGYYVLMFMSRAYAIGSGALPIAVYVWMPNAVTLAIAAVILMFGTRRVTA